MNVRIVQREQVIVIEIVCEDVASATKAYYDLASQALDTGRVDITLEGVRVQDPS